MNRLEGRTALITGGARGIGRAIAELFAAEGASVVVWDLEPEAGACWPEPAPLRMRVDIRDRGAVQEAAARLAVEVPAGVDVLINNAGINLAHGLSVQELEPGEWHAVIETNLTGTLNVTQALLPQLGQRSGGRIINLSSILACRGFPGQSAYAASKAGILGLTRVWARELGPRGITVNAIVPGYIDTGMNNAEATEFRRVIVSRTALRRLGTAADVAKSCLFLASDDASFLTAVELPVDGGLAS